MYGQSGLIPMDSLGLTGCSHLPRSAPDLTQSDRHPQRDISPCNGERTEAIGITGQRVTPDAILSRRFADSVCVADYSPLLRRPRTVLPHHNRSLSFRTMKRPTTQQILVEEGFRPRVATMPSDSNSFLVARRRLRERNLSPSPPVMDLEPESTASDDCYLLRSFSITAKGGVLNRGDLLRQRSRSNNSVASTGSSYNGGNGTSCASIATSYSSGPGRGVPCRVVMLGTVGVGKTALIVQFMSSEYMNAYECSQEDDAEKTVSVLLDGDEYELVFTDIPSSSDAVEVAGTEADAYVVVYSITDRGTFEKAVDILFSLREKGITANKAVILVGNKSDLVRSREISTDESRSVACTYECKFIETSAGINHNVDELLVGIVSQIRLKAKQKVELRHFASPTKGRKTRSKGSLRSSLRAKGILTRLLSKGSYRSKSCDNLHVL